jgi:hypothetical protein
MLDNVIKSGKANKREGNVDMSKATVLLGLIGAGFLAWGIGVLIRLWANPIFAYFWVVNNNMADELSYFGSGIGALLLALAIITYYRDSIRRTAKTFIVMPSQTFKLAMSEFHEDYWQKQLLQQKKADNVEYYQTSNRRTAKTSIVVHPQTFKLAMSEFHEDYWQKQLLQQTRTDNVEYHPFIIINGTRTNLGSEVMEKIVN